MSRNEQQSANAPVEKKDPGGFRHAVGMVWGLAAWLMGTVIGLFLDPPPHEDAWGRLAQFTSAVGIGLPLILFGLFPSRRLVLVWWGIAVLFCLGALGLFFKYHHMKELWTIELGGRIYMTGDEYQPEVKAFIKEKQRAFSDKEILENFEGEPANVWTLESRSRRAVTLGWWYVACAPLFAVSLIFLALAIRPFEKNRRPVH